MTEDGAKQGSLAWAVERWHAEVQNRPMHNVHRRALDTTWRQVIRHFGGDPDELLSMPPHHEMSSTSGKPIAEAKLATIAKPVAWLGEGDGFKSFTRQKKIADGWAKSGIKVTAVSSCDAPQAQVKALEWQSGGTVDFTPAGVAYSPPSQEEAKPVEALANAMRYWLHTDGAQYLLSNLRSWPNGALKAYHHDVLTKAYVAMWHGVDPDEVRWRFEDDYKAVHDETAENLTSRLDEVIGFDLDGHVDDKLIDRFLRAFHKIALAALDNDKEQRNG